MLGQHLIHETTCKNVKLAFDQPILRVATILQTRQPTGSQQGFTLVELMISMTIGLVLLLAIGTVFTSSRQVSRVQEDNARIQKSGRFPLKTLGRNS